MFGFSAFFQPRSELSISRRRCQVEEPVAHDVLRIAVGRTIEPRVVNWHTHARSSVTTFPVSGSPSTYDIYEEVPQAHHSVRQAGVLTIECVAADGLVVADDQDEVLAVHHVDDHGGVAVDE